IDGPLIREPSLRGQRCANGVLQPASGRPWVGAIPDHSDHVVGVEVRVVGVLSVGVSIFTTCGAIVLTAWSQVISCSDLLRTTLCRALGRNLSSQHHKSNQWVTVGLSERLRVLKTREAACQSDE